MNEYLEVEMRDAEPVLVGATGDDERSRPRAQPGRGGIAEQICAVAEHVLVPYVYAASPSGSRRSWIPRRPRPLRSRPIGAAAEASPDRPCARLEVVGGNMDLMEEEYSGMLRGGASGSRRRQRLDGRSRTSCRSVYLQKDP
jgi:hypothetical protein